MKTQTIQLDILELIFVNRNKDYGAYQLRRLYKKHLTFSLWFAILLFTGVTTIQYFLSTKANRMNKVKSYSTSINLPPPPSIIEKQNITIPEKVISSISTIKFLPPVIKPDEAVKDNFVPTIDELNNVQPGIITQIGDVNGVDINLIENIITPTNDNKPVETNATIFEWVEEMPCFKGGNEAMFSYLSQNITYPEIAKRSQVEGRVIISFIVSIDGNITEAKVIKSIGAGCDEEALRVVKNMPKWNPGKQNGNPVNVRVSIPIMFTLK